MNKLVYEIIEKIKNIGSNNMLVLCDFDDTLTKAFSKNGGRASSSCSVYSNNPYLLKEEYCKESRKLFNYYYEIEQNPDLTFEEKEEYMDEWWKKEFALYEKYKLSNDILNEIVYNNLIELRENTNIFFKILNEFNIPIVIFSGGNYNLIHKFLRKEHEDFENIHVISNIMEFDKNGFFTGVKGDFITSMNKNFMELKKLHLFEELLSKKSCILIGNSTSDVKMADGKNFDAILKIGFLNEKIGAENYQRKLQGHRKYYDVVIDGNDDFENVNYILEMILRN